MAVPNSYFFGVQVGQNDTFEEIKDRVKDGSDIVRIIGETVELKKAGARYLGLCPFHGEKTPSFSVHPGQQFFHCFGCGESGDVFSFMMKYHSLDFPAALKELARRAQIELPERTSSPAQQERDRQRVAMFAVNLEAAGLFRTCLLQSPGAARARLYLKERGIPEAVQERFQIGYAPAVEEAGWNFLGTRLKGEQLKAAEATGLLVRKEQGGSYDRFRDRIVFPLYDLRGRVVGFGGRIVGEGQPKYLNSPESLVFDKSSTLLGLFQQRDEIRARGRVVLVEGNFDCVSLVVHGCPNVVAPLGTALTRQQLGLLKRFSDEVILLFDGDVAGVKAARRAVPLFLAEQIKGRVALLPEGHDPDTFVRELGRARLDDLLDAAVELPEFALEQLVAEHGLTLDGKSRIMEELRPLVQAAASELQRSVVIAHFSERLGVEQRQLADLLKGARSQAPVPSEVPVFRAKGREERLEPMSSVQKRLVSHMVLYPQALARLEQAGVREMVAGTMGEVLLLQLLALQAGAGEVEPEDLLAALPEGAERRYVSEVLLAASGIEDSLVSEAGPEEELAEILLWLERERLQICSRQLIAEIARAERERDMGRLAVLLKQKQEVESRMRGQGPV